MNSKENDEIKIKYEKLIDQKQAIEEELSKIEYDYFKAKIYRAEVYIVDVNGEYGDNPFDYITNKFCGSYFNVEKRNILWCDEIDINHTNATLDTYRSYFDESD